MPEGDTIFRLAARLERALVGHVVTRCESAVVDVPVVHVRGARILASEARGKHLLVGLSTGYTLHAHLRMQGAVHLYARSDPAAKSNRPCRLRLETETATVAFARVPTLRLLQTTRLARDPTLSQLGPDPLREGFDADEAARRLAGLGETEIGVALLSQRCLAGVGNVLKSEALFIARLCPFVAARALSDADRRRLVDVSAELLRLNTRAAPRGAASTFVLPRRVTRVTSGALTGRGGGLWVYERAGRPCLACRTAIRRVEQAGRSTYFCPSCQGPAELIDRPR